MKIIENRKTVRKSRRRLFNFDIDMLSLLGSRFGQHCGTNRRSDGSFKLQRNRASLAIIRFLMFIRRFHCFRSLRITRVYLSSDLSTFFDGPIISTDFMGRVRCFPITFQSLRMTHSHGITRRNARWRPSHDSIGNSPNFVFSSECESMEPPLPVLGDCYIPSNKVSFLITFCSLELQFLLVIGKITYFQKETYTIHVVSVMSQ